MSSLSYEEDDTTTSNRYTYKDVVFFDVTKEQRLNLQIQRRYPSYLESKVSIPIWNTFCERVDGAYVPVLEATQYECLIRSIILIACIGGWIAIALLWSVFNLVTMPLWGFGILSFGMLLVIPFGTTYLFFIREEQYELNLWPHRIQSICDDINDWVPEVSFHFIYCQDQFYLSYFEIIVGEHEKVTRNRDGQWNGWDKSLAEHGFTTVSSEHALVNVSDRATSPYQVFAASHYDEEAAERRILQSDSAARYASHREQLEEVEYREDSESDDTSSGYEQHSRSTHSSETKKSWISIPSFKNTKLNAIFKKNGDRRNVDDTLFKKHQRKQSQEEEFHDDDNHKQLGKAMDEVYQGIHRQSSKKRSKTVEPPQKIKSIYKAKSSLDKKPIREDPATHVSFTSPISEAANEERARRIGRELSTLALMRGKLTDKQYQARKKQIIQGKVDLML